MRARCHRTGAASPWPMVSPRCSNMVRFSFLSVLLLGLAASSGLHAQKFDLNDTITEHPMKGTYYHNRFEGRKTASGEVFDQNLFTAAHKSIKMGTLVMVTNRSTGQQIVVKINDRCPKKGVLDMTRRAANGIGIKGSQVVSIRILPDSYEEMWASQDPLYDSVPSMYTSAKGDMPKTSPDRDSRQKSETVAAITEPEINTPKISTAKIDEDQGVEYNLLVGTVKTHGQAYDLIQKLPYHYQNSVIIDTLMGENEFRVILDLKLPKEQAEMLNRSMKNKFPKCTITTVQ